MNKGEVESEEKKEVSVLKSPHWLTVFFAIAVPASFVPLIIGFIFGLTVTNDHVFGIYALLSGTFADFIIRSKFKRALMVFQKPRVPFIMLWVLLCLYVIVFTPLQHV